MDDMIPGLRQHRSASLRVATTEAVPDEMRDGVRELIDVQSEEQDQGDGSGLLNMVCYEADQAGVLLILQPQPFADGMKLQDLLRWYAGFGFVRCQVEPVVLMARQPRAPGVLH